jgi:hypothetical protein
MIEAEIFQLERSAAELDCAAGVADTTRLALEVSEPTR